MGRIYRMENAEKDEIVAELKAGEIPGLSLVYKPLDREGKPSLWPEGITDGKNYGWFEDFQILFWASNDETNILKKLEEVGVQITYAG